MLFLICSLFYSSGTPAASKIVFETPPENFKPKVEVAACYISNGDQFLLLKTLESKSQGGAWGFPGGKLEPGETPLDAVIRETREETGIELKRDAVHFFQKFYVRDLQTDFIYYTFKYVLDQGPVQVFLEPSEHTEYNWVSLDEALKMSLIRGESECIACLKTDQIKMKNQKKFNALRAFDLPVGQYVIISSGPMGIRNLREIGDIDLIVTPELWRVLAERYGVVEKEGKCKIDFPGSDIEAFWEGSFVKPSDPNFPTIAERINQAEVIEGLPFDSLETTLLFKRYMGREKDIRDIALIQTWLQNQKLSSK